MLEEKDQILLMELFAAAILYLNIKQDDGNPFVKKLGTTQEKKALDVLTNATNNLEHLLPLLKEMDGLLNEAFDRSETPENKEVIDLKKYE